MRLTLSQWASPIGLLGLACDEAGALRGLSFGDGVEKTMRREYPGAVFAPGPPPSAVGRALDSYFGGDRDALSHAPWSLAGANGNGGFAGRVWTSLADVPTGGTVSYGEIAKRAGEPGAAQAAGVALNRNPLPLVLPCHRVIGADGAMVGFGGGLARKTWLLRHEGALLI